MARFSSHFRTYSTETILLWSCICEGGTALTHDAQGKSHCLQPIQGSPLGRKQMFRAPKQITKASIAVAQRKEQIIVDDCCAISWSMIFTFEHLGEAFGLRCMPRWASEERLILVLCCDAGGCGNVVIIAVLVVFCRHYRRWHHKSGHVYTGLPSARYSLWAFTRASSTLSVLVPPWQGAKQDELVGCANIASQKKNHATVCNSPF